MKIYAIGIDSAAAQRLPMKLLLKCRNATNKSFRNQTYAVITEQIIIGMIKYVYEAISSPNIKVNKFSPNKPNMMAARKPIAAIPALVLDSRAKSCPVFFFA